MNSNQVCVRADISYRQLDNWVRRGHLKPIGGEGIGNQRDFPAKEVTVAERMGALTRLGVTPELACAIARGDRAAITGVLGIVAECMQHGELRYRWLAAPETPTPSA